MGINMQMRPDTNPTPPPDFRPGDAVRVLYQGLYNGMAGKFEGPAEDPNWAYVREENGVVRAHPIAWMRCPAPAEASSAG
jgi:hypothetical protein